MRTGKGEDTAAALFEKYVAIGVSCVQKLVKIEMRDKAQTVFERVREVYLKTSNSVPGKKTNISEALLNFMICGIMLIFSFNNEGEQSSCQDFMELSSFIYASLK